MKKIKKLYTSYINSRYEVSFNSYEIKEECETHYVTDRDFVIYKPLVEKYQPTKKLALEKAKESEYKYAEERYDTKIRKAEEAYITEIERIRSVK